MFVFKTFVVTKLLVFAILFSISLIFVFETVVVTKPLISGIFYQHLQFSCLNCVYLCCIELCELNVVASGIFFSKLYTFVYSVLRFVFLTILSTTSLKFFKSIGTVFNIPVSKLSTFVFKLFKLVGTFTSLLISSLSTSAFKAVKSF